jgi:hypothetical protein
MTLMWPRVLMGHVGYAKGGVWFRIMRERSGSVPDSENRMTPLHVWK